MLRTLILQVSESCRHLLVELFEVSFDFLLAVFDRILQRD